LIKDLWWIPYQLFMTKNGLFIESTKSCLMFFQRITRNLLQSIVEFEMMWITIHIVTNIYCVFHRIIQNIIISMSISNQSTVNLYKIYCTHTTRSIRYSKWNPAKTNFPFRINVFNQLTSNWQMCFFFNLFVSQKEKKSIEKFSPINKN
jgi:hypothetical protein